MSPNPKEIQELIQDCNVNFLIGSGMSVPFLSALGNIENLLTSLDAKEIDPQLKNIIRASICKKYCEDAMLRNIDLLEDHPDSQKVQENYKNFLARLNSIMLKRKSSILGRQLNIFTTNMDIFFEKGFEATGVEFNDGFHGRFVLRFDPTNFRKSFMKKSLQYDYISEIPVFNLFKLHGSVSWIMGDGDRDVRLSWNLRGLRDLKDINLSDDDLVVIEKADDVDSLIKKAGGKVASEGILSYLSKYDALLIVNPTKEKFKHSLLNQTYYELLRVYSNELEKENTVLFVMGFSFADEHIRHVTLRAANANPTLKVMIYAHSTKAVNEIKANFFTETFRNNNVDIVGPTQANNDNGDLVDSYNYDFETVCEKVFNSLPDCPVGESDADDEIIAPELTH